MPETDKIKLDEYIDDLYNKVGDFAGEFLNNEGSGLYLLQSKVNHSCVPNAQSTFPYSNDIVVLKAIQAIQPGEEICISYLDECQLERSRHSRQKKLNDPDETSEDEYDDEMDDDDFMDD
ncbi:SET and MYND domain-containing protein 5 [Eumeta japonica]|uniref:SET and MYND domain-containing protein 5 n=1 Tax=Eumeta variegata TaxID=151549 RepID=A0A4C1SXI1_EUMVA|nr:SET and MYND domain-containing protein 5 [Eumeta japonica]